MKGPGGAILLAGSVILLAACGSGSNPNAGASSAQSAGTVQPVATSAASTPVPSSQAAATPATNPVERLSGTVQSVDGGKVTLKDGGSFALASDTRVARQAVSSPSALQPGETVAITAKRQSDNTLLASIVVAFPPSSKLPLGQHPMDAGNLMTNATIDKVQGNGFSATFPGGSEQVSVAPDGQVKLEESGTQADIKAGSMVSAAVRNGTAQSVTIQ